MTKFNWREGSAGLIVPVVLIAIWHSAASLGWVNAHVLPSPLAVVTRWIAYLLPQVPYAEAPGSWLGALVVMLTGLGLFESRRRPFVRAWDA